MALLFHSEIDQADDWLPQLRRHLPDIEIRTSADPGSLADIRYALVWRPPYGLLAKLENLRAILSLGAGVDHLFADPTLPSDVPIARVIDPQLTAGIVEYGLACVLAAHRRLPDYARQQRQHIWRIRGQRRASETNVAILGFGQLGTALAQACASLGFRVAGWRRRPGTDGDDGMAVYHGEQGLPAVLGQAHIVICLLPLTDLTRGILDKTGFGQMPAGAWFINIARGAHVVDADLIAALDSGHLSGAFLDVFRAEPLPPAHPFWDHPKISMTPHIAAITDARSVAGQIAENVRRAAGGEALINPVDRARGY